MDNFENYQSPFSWRYASEKMRKIWSETHKRQLWRKIWVALARVQGEYDLVTQSQIDELVDHSSDIDIQTSLKIEAEIHHDLMAELKTYAAQCPQAGGILHMGATSMDIEDNADALRLRESLDLVLERLEKLLLSFADQIEKYAGTPVIGFTHIQPAEPTTLGYRLAISAQDLWEDWQELKNLRETIRGKGFKGAVGTAAAYADLIGDENLDAFEKALSVELALPFFELSTQTYPRKQDYRVLSMLAGLGATIHKFAFDLRILQSPPLGELSEPFAKKQVGSSAMPFKRNPIQAEKLDSLARQLSVLPQIAWQDAANSLLERTLDDSANRRTILPEAFLICDELLIVSTKLIENLVVYPKAIERNLGKFAPFASTERIMMAAVKRGADRQQIHERLRGHAMQAWQSIQSGKANPLLSLICEDELILKYLSAREIIDLGNVKKFIGIATRRSYDLVDKIRNGLSKT